MATVAPPIRNPTLEIFQQAAPATAVIPLVTLTPCVIAPNYQVVSALDSNGNFQAEGLLGTYQDADATITYALPDVEMGSVLREDSVRVWLRVGQESSRLDGPGDEEIVISSSGSMSVDDPGADSHTLTDAVQDFSGTGVLANQEIEGADYVVRMEGTDGLTHDFPVTGVTGTTLVVGNDPDGDTKPASGSQAYAVVLNPTKFVVNSDALNAVLRVNVETATLPVGAADAALLFTAVAPGADGNDVTVTITDTGSLSVAVVGEDIAIGVDLGTTTALQIKTAVDADAEAAQLVTTTNGGGTGGDPLAAGIAQTNLSGGSHFTLTDPTGGAAGNSKRAKLQLAGSPGDPLALQLAANDLTIILENSGGSPASTVQEVVDAINSNASPAYQAAVDDFVDAVAFGDTAAVPVVADLSSFTALSGGFDAASVTLDANLLGSTSIAAKLYVSYRSLRRVYTAAASQALTNNDPVLVSADNQTDLAARVGVLTDDNPLGLMMFLALQNNQGRTVYGLGIDEISDSEDDGTAAAWQRAADFMTGQTPYFVTVGSQRDAIHDIWLGHSDLMNGDEFTSPAILERYLFINKELPLLTSDEALASGDDMGLPSAGELTASENFTLAGAQSGDVVVLEGISDGYDYVLQDGSRGYEITGVKGGDPYTLELVSAGPAAASDVDWTLYRPGQPLQVAGVWDKQTLAETISLKNDQINRRKVSSTFPDNVTVPVNGSDKNLPGYYADAAQVGQCAAQAVSASKSNQPLLGLSGLRYSGEFFSEPQLNIIQGGGTWTRWQPVPGGAVLTRMALTTDTDAQDPKLYNPTSSWQADKYSRLIRSVTKSTLAGTINRSLLDQLSFQLDYVGKQQKDAGELARRPDISSIRQGDGQEAPTDRIIVETDVYTLQPNNGIRLYMSIAS